MELRPYQKEDAIKLVQFDASGCFNEQRTGKTPTALATIKLRNIENERVLVVATASSLYQWKTEYERWLGVPCVVCAGTPTQKKKILKEWTNGLVVSLDSLKITARSEGLLKDIKALKPVCVILDEAHRIKTPKTASAKAMFALSNVKYKLALTGTPAPGKAYDVFSILKFLRPKEYTSEWNFKEEFFKAERKTVWQGRQQRTFVEFNDFKPGKCEELQNILAEFTTQRKRVDVMPWLPAKDYTRIKLEPTKIQEKALKQLQSSFRVGNLQTIGVLDTLIRERQLCLDPKLLDIEGKSPKTEWIKQYIKDYPDEPIIIFSKFTSYLKLLYNELEKDNKLAMIIGATPTKQREQYKKDFQAGVFNILLVNIDAGKEALTLDRAETAIFTDKYPPIGDILQAEDRFVATTENLKDKPHKIIELMINGTFDERIYKLLEDRLTETDVINNYNKYISKGARRL